MLIYPARLVWGVCIHRERFLTSCQGSLSPAIQPPVCCIPFMLASQLCSGCSSTNGGKLLRPGIHCEHPLRLGINQGCSSPINGACIIACECCRRDCNISVDTPMAALFSVRLYDGPLGRLGRIEDKQPDPDCPPHLLAKICWQRLAVRERNHYAW